MLQLNTKHAASQPTQHTAIKNNQLKPIKTNEAVILEPPLTSSAKRRVISLSGDSPHSPSPPTSNNCSGEHGHFLLEAEREREGGKRAAAGSGGSSGPPPDVANLLSSELTLRGVQCGEVESRHG